MSSTKTAKKPASAGARVDPKKVATLRETFPFLTEDAATLHLTEANGNMAVATDLVLNGERWQKTATAKPRKAKEEKVEEQPARRPERKREDRDREPRKPLPKRSDRPAAPAAPETTAAQVQQKDVTSSSWVKGQGLSFLDMLKKKTEAEQPPPPPPVVETPALPVVEEAAPAAPAPEPAAEEKPVKQRREKKPRAEAPPAAAVEAVEVAPVVAPVAPPKPVVVKHVLRFDRVDELLLPPHMADLALRSGNQYTFSGTPGVEQSPPPQPQPVNSFQQSAFAMQRTWGNPEHNVAPSQRWNDNGAAWSNIPQQQRFTTYQPPPQRSFNQFPSGGYPPQQRFQNNNHHSHHRGHEQQASNDAYNAIRETYNHHTGATW